MKSCKFTSQQLEAGDNFIKKLLKEGANVNTANKYGDKLLHLAASYGSPAIVSELLDLGAYINITNINGITPLHLAAKHGHIEAFELLLDKGADINSLDGYGQSPILLAAGTGYLHNVMELLFKRSINVNMNNFNNNSLLYCVIKNGDILTLKLLLNNGIDVNMTNDKGETPLYVATKHRKKSIVELLLQNGADSKATNDFVDPVLHLAAQLGELHMVELLLDAGSDIDVRNDIQDTTLHWALKFGTQSAVELILHKGADVNKTNIYGESALHLAMSKKEDPFILNLLLTKCGDVNSMNKKGTTPLHLAVEERYLSATELLLENGADINATDNEGNTPLHLALSGGETSIIKLLINIGAKVNTKNAIGNTPLHLAAKQGEVSIMEMLLQEIVDVNITNNYGDQPLHLAIEKGNISTAELLLKRGANVTTENRHCYTPLQLAIDIANPVLVEQLLKKGSDVNIRTVGRNTLLHSAVTTRCPSTVELLLREMIDVNAKNENGSTPLHFAAELGEPTVVDLLLSKGATTDIALANGDLPIHLAVMRHTNSVVKLLLDRGSPVNTKNNVGNTPLHLAVINRKEPFVKLLLDKGATVNTKNNKDETPLYLAVFYEETSIANMLLNNIANVHTSDKNGNTPLHTAALINSSNLVKLLLLHGANVKYKNRAGETPLKVVKVYQSEYDEEIVNMLQTAEKSQNHVVSLKTQRFGYNIFSQIVRCKDLVKIQNKVLHNDPRNEFKYLKTDSSGMCGQLYETKLLSLVLLRALNDHRIEKFFLGTNIQGIGDMDDICLRFQGGGRQTPVVLFVQAKHRDDKEKGKLTVENLQNISGDYSLQKYFDSYLKIKNKFRADTDDPMFEGDFNKVECNFVIYTPAKDCIARKKTEQNINKTVHSLIDTGQNTNAFQYDYDESDIECLTEMTVIEQLQKLGTVFLALIMSEKNKPEVILTDKLIASYHVIMAREILQLKKMQPENKDYRYWEFRSEFFVSKSKYLVALRTTFFKEILFKRMDQSKISKVDHENVQHFIEFPCPGILSKLIGKLVTYNEKTKKLQVIEISTIAKMFKTDKLSQFTETLNKINEKVIDDAIYIKLLSMEIKLPLSFGNLDMTFRGNVAKVQKRAKTVADKLINLLEMNKETYIININDNIVGPGKILEQGIIDTNGGIGGAVGNLLVLDTDTNLLKFELDNKALPQNASIFLNELTSKLGAEILNKYRIKVSINGFSKCSFDGDEYQKEQAKDFLDKLWFFCEQAKQDEVEHILKCDINKFYNDEKTANEIKIKIDPHDIYLEAHNNIQKWWMLRGEVNYFNKENDVFEKAKLVCIDNLLLTVNKLMRDMEICSVDIKFNTQLKFDNLAIDADETFYSALSELGCLLNIQNKSINIKTEDKREIVNLLIKSFSDWKENRSLSKPIISKEEPHKKSGNVYKKRTGTSAISGYLYKTKLLSLILLRSLNDAQNMVFFLGNNIQNIGAMDDICLRYQVIDQRKPIVLFLQAKHREDTEKGRLTVEDVRGASGDFSLRKYFDSYLKIKDRFEIDTEDPLFKGDFHDVECCFVVYTSSKDCFSKKRTERNLNEKIHHIINTGQSTSNVFQYDYNETDIDNLTNMVVMNQLTKLIMVFLDLIMSDSVNSDAIFAEELLARYHVVLGREVLEPCASETNQKFRMWKFRSGFFENACAYKDVMKKTLIEKFTTKCCDHSKITNEDIENMREFIKNPCPFTISKVIGKVTTYNYKTNKLEVVGFLDLKDTSREQLEKIYITKNDIYNAIRLKLLSMEFQLPLSFGNLDMTFRGSKAEVEERKKTVTGQLIKLLVINDKEIIDINEDVVGPGKILEPDIISINGGFGSAVGNLLIFDTDSLMLKFDLDNKELPACAASFLNILKDQRYNAIGEKLDKYRIKVNLEKFPKYYFKADDYDKRQARDFLDKLWFYVNQAKEDEVERILKDELHKYYDNQTSHTHTKYGNPVNSIYLRSYDVVQNWSIETNESPYYSRLCKLFEHAKLADIYNLLLSVINYLYVTRKYRIHWTFNRRNKSPENGEKINGFFGHMYRSLLKMFYLQDQVIDIKHPHARWYPHENLESSFSLEIHPEMESVVLRMLQFSRGNAGDFAVIAKADLEGGRVLMLTADKLKEILVPPVHSTSAIQC